MRGLTLIELMVALAVAVILATIAVPSYSSFIANQRVKAGSQSLYTSLLLARAEAIKRNRDVTVTRDGDAWSDGWKITYQDSLGNEHVIRQQQGLEDLAITTGADSLTFTRVGRAAAGAQFVFCDASGRSGISRRQVSIDTSGRPSIAVDGGCTS